MRITLSGEEVSLGGSRILGSWASDLLIQLRTYKRKVLESRV